jgi:hypothetical protein
MEAQPPVTRAVVGTGTIRYAKLIGGLHEMLGVQPSRDQLQHDIALVSEGLCPWEGHGPLRLRPLRPGGHTEQSAGWCGRCRRGYSARTHRHDEDCAGPDLNEAELWCPYEQGEATICWWEPNAFAPDVYQAVGLQGSEAFTSECRWCGQQNGHADGCPLA